MDNRLLWLWLQNVCGAGSSMPELLLDAFDLSIEKLYDAAEPDYASFRFIKDSLKQKLCNKELKKAKQILAYCENEGIGIVTPDSSLYPRRLSRIQSKPIVLYYKGTLVDLDKEVCIAEVGTRDMTEYGCHTAYSMAYDMAKAGAAVISGMAKGVDGMAHRGAIDAGGYTVAVLGCGIDRAYPPEHQSLMNEIIKYGVVLTEYPPFTPPYGRNFPIRNRIISGLSLGTLVIEAPTGSGALITAKTAIKQGREVFAIPGKLGEMTSAGTNELIKQGAKIVVSASDVLLEYQSVYSGKINLNRINEVRSNNYKVSYPKAANSFSYSKNDTEKKQIQDKSSSEPKKEKVKDERTVLLHKLFSHSKAKTEPEEIKEKPYTIPENVSELGAQILKSLLDGDKTSDELSVLTQKNVNDVLVELTMLEIGSYISAMPGGSYKLNRK